MSLRPVAIAAENDHRSKQFIRTAQILAMHAGDLPAARAYAAAKGMLPEIQTVLKSAVAPGSISSGELSPLHEFERMGAAYLETLRSSCAFDALLPSMKNVPFRSRVVIVTVGAVGSVVAEGAPKPISSVTLENNEIAQAKAVAICVLTRELLQHGGPQILDLFERELRGALSVTTDKEFIRLISAGVTPITSAGPSAAQIRTDCKLALVAININAQSKLYWIVSPSIAASLATKEASGESAFEQMTPMGGALFGVPVVVSDGLASNTLVLVDANGIAAASGAIEIASSGQAALQMDSAPTNPPVAATIARSLFQHNETAIKLARYFGAERLGNSVAVVGGIAY